MVIERLHGPQTHYRAAQKFLKNRTLRKMNDTGMTLYERIMAYRKLKEGEEVAGVQPRPTSESKPAATEQQPSPQRRAATTTTTSDNNNSRAATQPATNESPAKRSTSSSSSSSTPRKLERSDTSFASVDISDITQLDEEKNRSPTPQPTFEDRPTTAQAERQVARNYEEKTTARDVFVQLEDTEDNRITERHTSAAMTSSAVTTAAVATHYRTSSADSRQVRKTQADYKESVSDKEKQVTRSEKYENKETRTTDKYENKQDVERSANRQDKREEKRVEKYENKEEVRRSEDRQDKRKENREEKYERSVEEAVRTAAVAKSVSESSSSSSSKQERSEDSRKDAEKHETRSEKSRVEKSQSTRSSSRSSSKAEKDKSFIEEVSDGVRASITEPRTPEPSRTPEAPAVEAEESPVVQAGPSAAAATPKAKKATPRPKSGARKKRDPENDATIAALDKLADRNLQRLLGNDDGGDDDDPEVDQEVLDKVFNPKFQAELDDFLRTT